MLWIRSAKRRMYWSGIRLYSRSSIVKSVLAVDAAASPVQTEAIRPSAWQKTASRFWMPKNVWVVICVFWSVRSAQSVPAGGGSRKNSNPLFIIPSLRQRTMLHPAQQQRFLSKIRKNHESTASLRGRGAFSWPGLSSGKQFQKTLDK